MLSQKPSKREKFKKGLKSLFKKKDKEKNILSSENFATETTESLTEVNSESSKNKPNTSFARKTKTIFLIGSTGKGKSTLANTLANEVSEEGLFKNFQEIFRESQDSVSGTREIQSKEFVGNGIDYVIIDTVGLGDTKLKKEEVLDKLAEAVYQAKDGISHIFFVIGVKFDEKEMANYNLLKSIIFDKDAVNYTTIIRTRFEKFEDGEKCKTDSDLMIKGGGELAEIIESCGERVIHVDNPSLNLFPDDDEDEEKEAKRIKEEVENRKKIRISSRKKLLEHLLEVCQDSSYQPSKLKELGAEISAYMEEKLKKKEELAQKEVKKRNEPKRKEKVEIVNDLIGVVENSKVERNDLTIENPKQQIVNNNLEMEEFDQEAREKEKKAFIKSKISSLENELKELEEAKQLIEDIQVAEGAIRQVIFNHIFNNINDIAQVTGSDNFLNSIIGDNNNSYKGKLSLIELQKQKEQLETQLLGKGRDNQSLDDINNEIKSKEQKLLNIKKELLIIKETFEKWEKESFTLQQIQDWANVLGESFNPESDAGFCAWLRDDRELAADKIKEMTNIANIEQLRQEYADYLEKENIILEGHYRQLGEGQTKLKNKFIDLDNKDEAWIYLANLMRVLTKDKKEATNEEEASKIIKEIIVNKRLTSDAHDSLVYLETNWDRIPATFNIKIKRKRENWSAIRNENEIKQLIDSHINYDRNLLDAWKKYYYFSALTAFQKNLNLSEEVIAKYMNSGDVQYYVTWSYLVETEIPAYLAKLKREVSNYAEFANNFAQREGKKLEDFIAEHFIKPRSNDEHYYWHHDLFWEEVELALKEKTSPAQKWLDRNYPKNERKKIKILSIKSSKQLEGHLDLRDFINLEKLHLDYSTISGLDISTCTKLIEFRCGVNPNLKTIDLSQNKKLKVINFGGSSNFRVSLDTFSHLVELEWLDLNTTLCYGSLKFLSKLNKLKTLWIEGISVDSNLEYLPEGLERINFRNENLVPQEIRKKLKDYKMSTLLYGDTYSYDYQAWKKDHQKLIENANNDNKLIEIQFPLKDIPSKYWAKVAVDNDWDREYVEAEEDKSLGWGCSRSIPMMHSFDGDGIHAPWDMKFKSQEILDNFRKYVDVNEKITSHWANWERTGRNYENSFVIKHLKANDMFRTHNPSQITQLLKDANKLFLKNGHGKTTSQEAFEFLQSIIESKEIMATIKLTQEELKEFKQENQLLQAQIEILPKN